MSHMATVQQLYMDFGQGNVAAISEKLAEDINWDIHSTLPEVPWLKPRKGRAEAMGFEALAGVQFTKFTPHTFFENGNQVFVLVDLEAIFPASDKVYTVRNEGHLWTFNAAGLVTDYEHLADTLLHLKALKGE